MISKSLNFTFNVTVRPREPLVLAMPPDLVDQRLQFGDHRFEFGQIGGERVLGANRLPDPVRADLAVVDASGDPVIVCTHLTEVGLHEVQRLIAHVEAGVEAERVHLRARRRPLAEGGPLVQLRPSGKELHDGARTDFDSRRSEIRT
jgi:hypothetical protein